MSDGVKKIQIQAVIEDQDLRQIQKCIDSVIHAAHICCKNALQVHAVMYLGIRGQHKEEEALCEYINQASSDEVSIKLAHFPDQQSKYGILSALVSLEEADFEMIIRPDLILEARSLFRMLSCENVDKMIIEPRHTPIETAKDYNQDTGETEWASDDCMMIPRELFTLLHGFDEQFSDYYGDVDFSLRARAKGYHIRYVPSAMVFCPQELDEQGCLMESDTQKITKNRDRLFYVHKWGSESHVKALRTALHEMGQIGKEALKQFDETQIKPAEIDAQDKRKYANFLNMDFCNLRY